MVGRSEDAEDREAGEETQENQTEDEENGRKRQMRSMSKMKMRIKSRAGLVWPELGWAGQNPSKSWFFCFFWRVSAI